jgi:hypothetical protein
MNIICGVHDYQNERQSQIFEINWVDKVVVGGCCSDYSLDEDSTNIACSECGEYYHGGCLLESYGYSDADLLRLDDLIENKNDNNTAFFIFERGIVDDEDSKMSELNQCSSNVNDENNVNIDDTVDVDNGNDIKMNESDQSASDDDDGNDSNMDRSNHNGSDGNDDDVDMNESDDDISISSTEERRRRRRRFDGDKKKLLYIRKYLMLEMMRKWIQMKWRMFYNI